jgi:hypothetical protein
MNKKPVPQPTPIKVEAVKIRILKALLEQGGQQKSDLIRVVRHYIPTDRNAAIDDLIENKDIIINEVPTIKPGPNPQQVWISNLGQLTLRELKQKHGIKE